MNPYPAEWTLHANRYLAANFRRITDKNQASFPEHRAMLESLFERNLARFPNGLFVLADTNAPERAP